MAVIRLQVFYHKGVQGKWSNVYHAEADTLGAVGLAFFESMRDPLLDLLHVACTLDKVLISSLEDETFIETPIGMGGTNGDTDDLMPLFNSAKALFATAGLGRPDYKFMKGILTDDANESGFIASSVMTHIQNVFNTIITDMSGSGAPLVSDSGDLWTGTSVQAEIQMRQMHRRRRRTTPTP
jgi:hypothetical protein